ncbi:MAG: methyl-accepting chemotaxis protein [Vulcanimicrobiota bacterium]
MTPILSEGMTRALDLLRSASSGSFEARASAFDLQGSERELLLALNDFIDIVDAYVRESQASMSFASQGKFFRRMMERGLPGSFGAGARVINQATTTMEKQSELLKNAQKERHELADEFERAISGLSAQMVESSSRMTEMAEKLTRLQAQSVSSAGEVFQAAELTNQHIQTIAAATEELDASIKEIERNFGISVSASDHAGQACEEARGSVLELAESSQAIESVVRNIGQVASQTRMLALNANIEAARAGDLGRGFAVVASEVKGLANQTQTATEHIQQTISRVQSGTRSALTGTEKVRDSVQNIRTLANEVRDQLHFQRSATSEINQSLHQASSLSMSLCRQSDQVSQGCEQSQQAARAVQAEADRVAEQANDLQVHSQKLLLKVRS